MAFYPYLNFGRNCREAFTRYHEIFGGDVNLLGMADLPPGEMEVAPEQADLVMHAALSFDGHLLMASDTGQDDHRVQGMYVNVSVPTVEEAERIWGALSAGGTVEMPMEATFWSPAFGVCVDRFGTPWMVSADPVEQ